MQFIEFRDHCVIKRADGGKDEWDNQTRETIYDGPALYEEGGTTNSRIFTIKSPTVFIPDADGSVKINDRLVITTEFGRVIDSVVKSVRDVNMPWRTNVKVTRIELKQAQGE